MFEDYVTNAVSIVAMPQRNDSLDSAWDGTRYLVRSLEIAAVAYRLGLDPEVVEAAWKRLESIVRETQSLKIEETLKVPYGKELYGSVVEFTMWF